MINVPLAAGSGSTEFRSAYTGSILPAVEAYDPDLLLVSAGFDAHEQDPLAHLNLQTVDFAWVTRELMRVAARVCDGRLICVLEGGYDTAALADSVAAVVRELQRPSCAAARDG